MLSNKTQTAAAIIKRTVAALRADIPDISHVFVVGYCWGGAAAIQLAGEADHGLSGIVSTHPGQVGLYTCWGIFQCVLSMYSDCEVCEGYSH
jgi:dienelactone hydrolase